jgi:formate dehydrogenase major subunit
VLKEINGYTWPNRKQIADLKDLEGDGSTAGGCWIYTGVFPRNDFNHARSRVPDTPDGPGTHLGWGFSWPTNRRILYNRASADLDGRPWSVRKRYVWWDAEKNEWTGKDKPDFNLHKEPSMEPDWSKQPEGMDALDGKSPFIMIADGKSSLFVPSGLKGGPLPAH